PHLRVRRRRARRPRERGRRGGRGAPDRRHVEPDRRVRQLDRAGAATAGRVRDHAGRPARETVGPLRPYAGAQGMRPSLGTTVSAAVAVVAAVVIALLAFGLSDYHRSTGATVAVFFIAILALDIVTGYTGQISIGHGAFMAVGGYTTAILTHNHG